MSQASPFEEKSASTSPPSGKPRREGNDSLWKRARRTLGTNSLTFLQPTTRPAVHAHNCSDSVIENAIRWHEDYANIWMVSAGPSAPATGPAAPSKRREQVRHAQRTHRQRTQNYIKTLESEVVRLRESETNLMQERDKLRSQVDTLKTTIILSHIPLPEGIEDTRTSSSPLQTTSPLDMPATVSYSNDSLDHPRLHVNFPQRQDPSSAAIDYPTQTYPLPSPYQEHQQYNNVPQSAHDLPNDFTLNTMNFSPSSPQQSRPKLTTLVDTIGTAIDFVLALEHPCMPHLPYQDPPSADPANHMMMASTPLMARSPDPPHLNTTWTASGAIIKELLNLSSSINLEGEITPVEAWHRLHDHPDFWTLDRNQIEELKRELSTAVTCYGFGAVLDEQVFWDAVNRSLASSVFASSQERSNREFLS